MSFKKKIIRLTSIYVGVKYLPFIFLKEIHTQSEFSGGGDE